MEKKTSTTKKLNPYITPAQAIVKYGSSLTSFEQSEILEYQYIYYCGNKVERQKKVQGIPRGELNCGYVMKEVI